MSLPAQLHSSLQSTGAGQYICNTAGEGRVSSSLVGLAPRCSVAQNPHTLKTKLHGLSCAPTLERQQASVHSQSEWLTANRCAHMHKSELKWVVLEWAACHLDVESHWRPFTSILVFMFHFHQVCSRISSFILNILIHPISAGVWFIHLPYGMKTKQLCICVGFFLWLLTQIRTENCVVLICSLPPLCSKKADEEEN